MSNYLQNLIAKSFNQAEVARPRLASIFEPLPPSAPLAFDEIRTAETLDFEGTHRDERSTNTMKENRQVAESKNVLALPTMNLSSEKIETSVWRGNQQSATPEEQSVARQTLHRQTLAQDRVDVQAPVLPQVSETKPQESASRKSPGANLKESNLQAKEQQTAARGSEAALPSPPARTAQEENNRLKQTIQPLSRKPLAPQMQNPPAQIRRPINGQPAERERKDSRSADLPGAMETNKVTVQPRVALPVESQRASARLNPSHQPPLAQPGDTPVPPTINVTIGRIEVRATPQASPGQARKQPPVAQTMSLDEYLRKRNQGGEG